MKTCYLHLGMPKTGSTSIQNSFFGFENAEVAYAKLNQANHQTVLNNYFSRNPGSLPNNRRRELRGQALGKEVRKRKQAFQKAAKTKKSVIFSGEGILDQLKPDEVAEMMDYFAQRFDRVVPIIYVRPLASLVSSQFQQRVKVGLGEFSLPAPDYEKRFGPIVDVVGAGAVTFVRFDRSDLIGGDVVTDFAHRIGLDAAPKSAGEENESLSAEAVGAMFGFNKYTGWMLQPQYRTTMLQRLKTSLRSVGERKFGLSEDLIAKTIEENEDDIKWMEGVGGFDVRGRIKTVPEPIGCEQELLDVAADLSRSNRQDWLRSRSAGGA